VPSDRAGQISKFDAQRLTEFRAALDEIFKTDLCGGRPAHGSSIRGNDPRFAAANVTDGNLDTYWATDDGVTTGSVEIEFESAQPVNVINVQEYIPLGERVRRYHIEAKTAGQWQTVAGGTIIGQRNLLRIPAVTAQALRLVIDEAAACPAICSFGAYHSELAAPAGSGSLAAHQPAEASNVHGGGTVFGADKAVDDDPETRWATADEVRQCWLEVDLRQPQTIDRITIAELEPRITKFQIEYRLTPDEAWKTAMSGDKAGRRFEAKFPPVQARHVRLHILEATFAPTLWEFGVFGPAKPERKP
jgi:alpha-L-fucosidase